MNDRQAIETFLNRYVSVKEKASDTTYGRDIFEELNEVDEQAIEALRTMLGILDPEDADLDPEFEAKDARFPDALAVDPEGCGCTECCIGEYIPQEIFLAVCTSGDLRRLRDGSLGNNTYFSDEDLIEKVRQDLLSRQ